MPTKEHKRQIRQTIEGLELRIHRGPPIGGTELQSVRDFLFQNDFSPASDYFCRLAQIQERMQARAKEVWPAAKGNFGGESAGRYLQVQSAFDHIIVSTCYEGDFNTRHGRIKISHRFNREGRIDFVELKFLRPLQPCLAGEIRKLLLIRDYQSLRKNWIETEAFVLPVLPQELIFLYPELFRSPRMELLAWLINIGHGMVADLSDDLNSRSLAIAGGNHHCTATAPLSLIPEPARTAQGGSSSRSLSAATNQMSLPQLVQDEVAWTILNKAACLTSVVEPVDAKTVVVRYQSRPTNSD